MTCRLDWLGNHMYWMAGEITSEELEELKKNPSIDFVSDYCDTQDLRFAAFEDNVYILAKTLTSVEREELSATTLQTVPSDNKLTLASLLPQGARYLVSIWWSSSIECRQDLPEDCLGHLSEATLHLLNVPLVETELLLVDSITINGKHYSLCDFRYMFDPYDIDIEYWLVDYRNTEITFEFLGGLAG